MASIDTLTYRRFTIINVYIFLFVNVFFLLLSFLILLLNCLVVGKSRFMRNFHRDFFYRFQFLSYTQEKEM